MEKTKATNKPISKEVLREFPPLGKYRVRLVRNPRRPAEAPTLDIREYVSSENFEGFTRRGIRVGDRAQMDLLRDVLKEILEAGGFAKPAPGLLPAQ
ncbi:MAG: hypothetical protein HY293_08750 [Planctomycetes bacterium]|nr:hypothetical protein [Planctomycetota bacterium]